MDIPLIKKKIEDRLKDIEWAMMEDIHTMSLTEEAVGKAQLEQLEWVLKLFDQPGPDQPKVTPKVEIKAPIVQAKLDTPIDSTAIQYSYEKAKTAKAVLYILPNYEEKWIPRSVITKTTNNTVYVKTWWHDKNWR